MVNQRWAANRTLTLQDKATSPNTEVILPIAIDRETQQLQWTESRVETIPPSQLTGPLDWSHQDPLDDFVWVQDDWSGGALQPYWRQDEPNRYSISDGCDLRWEGIASISLGSGSAISHDSSASLETIGFDNPSAEYGTSQPWNGWTTGAGITDDQVSTPAIAQGSKNFRLTTDGSRTTGDNYISQDLVDATLSPASVWQGNSITVGCYGKYVSGTGNSSIRLYIADGIGTTTGTQIDETDTSTTFMTVTRSINASATKVEIGIEHGTTNESAVNNWDVDGFFISITDDTAKWVGFAEEGGNTYGAIGPFILKRDATNTIWRVVYINSGEVAADIAHFDGNIYVAYGDGADYVYGSDTSWTASNRTGAEDNATYFATGRNSAGVYSLWKSRAGNLSASSDPTNGGAAYSAEIQVGSTDRAITGIYSAFDTILVGKEDGLWAYQRFTLSTTATDDNKFVNRSEGASFSVNAENFTQGYYWKGWFYTTTAQQGLLRWRPPNEWEEYGQWFNAPRLSSDVGGRIRAIGADAHQLWLAVDSTETDLSRTKLQWLASMRQDGVQLTRPHLLEKLQYGDADAFTIGGHAALARRELLMAVRAQQASGTNMVYVTRLALPIKTLAGFTDSSPSVRETGLFETSIWHGGVPNLVKAFHKLEIWCEDLDSTHTIQVKFGVDGAAPSTTTLGTFNGTDAIQSLYFNDLSDPITDAVGRTIQLQFTFDSGSPSASSFPKLYAFALHSSLSLEQLREWEFTVEVGRRGRLDNWRRHPSDASTIIADLRTLETQDYPIVMKYDIDGDGADESVVVIMREIERIQNDALGNEQWRIRLREVDVS